MYIAAFSTLLSISAVFDLRRATRNPHLPKKIRLSLPIAALRVFDFETLAISEPSAPGEVIAATVKSGIEAPVVPLSAQELEDDVEQLIDQEEEEAAKATVPTIDGMADAARNVWRPASAPALTMQSRSDSSLSPGARTQETFPRRRGTLFKVDAAKAGAQKQQPLCVTWCLLKALRLPL